MTALEVVRAAPGLDGYLADVEEELARVVELYPGLVAEVGRTALAAGGKRLRPALAFLSSSPDEPPPLAAGVAVELVHMATLVHDDLIDGAAVRRGRTAAWREHGEEAAKAAGDYLFSRAFAVLAETRDPNAVSLLAFCRQHEDWDGGRRRFRAKRLAHLHPVHARKHDVEHNEVGRRLPRSEECIAARSEHRGVISRPVQIVLDELCDIRAVLDNQHACHAAIL